MRFITDALTGIQSIKNAFQNEYFKSFDCIGVRLTKTIKNALVPEEPVSKCQVFESELLIG